MSNGALTATPGAGAAALTRETSFHAPDQIQSVPGLIAYAELERRLDHSRASRRIACSTIGFRIQNARLIYAAAGTSGYGFTVTHVASVILGLLDDPELALAHAGGGEILSLVSSHLPHQAKVLTRDIALHIAQEASAYRRLGLPLPIVRVGQPMAIGLFGYSGPEEQLERARAAIRSESR